MSSKTVDDIYKSIILIIMRNNDTTTSITTINSNDNNNNNKSVCYLLIIKRMQFSIMKKINKYAQQNFLILYLNFYNHCT